MFDIPRLPSTLESLQSPGPPFGADTPSKSGAPSRLVLVRNGVTDSGREGRLLGMQDEALTTLGQAAFSFSTRQRLDLIVINYRRTGPAIYHVA